MKDWLRSLLIPDKPAPPRRRQVARALPSSSPQRSGTQRAPGDSAKTAPAISGAAKGAPAQQDWGKSLDGRQAATILREMIRMKLKDPDYAKRFAEALKGMLRDADKKND